MRLAYRKIACIITANILLMACSENISESSKERYASLSPSERRAIDLKELERKAAKSDPQAQVELAKLLLDGSEPTPNLVRAKQLFQSAADRGNPEGHLGLVLFSKWKLLPQENLTESELTNRAIALGDPFVTAYSASHKLDNIPQKLFDDAEAGYVLAAAKLGRILKTILLLQSLCEINKKSNVATEFQKNCDQKTDMDIQEAGLMLKKYANMVMNAGVSPDAEKYRAWYLIDFRLGKLSSIRTNFSSLDSIYDENVRSHANHYALFLAETLTGSGKLILDRAESKQAVDILDRPLAIKFIMRASELGDSSAQAMMGELDEAATRQKSQTEPARLTFTNTPTGTLA